VRTLLGRPSDVQIYLANTREAWIYRILDEIGNTARVFVDFDLDGTVTGTSKVIDTPGGDQSSTTGARLSRSPVVTLWELNRGDWLDGDRAWGGIDLEV
jgi:hypothetical protein